MSMINKGRAGRAAIAGANRSRVRIVWGAPVEVIMMSARTIASPSFSKDIALPPQAIANCSAFLKVRLATVTRVTPG